MQWLSPATSVISDRVDKLELSLAEHNATVDHNVLGELQKAQDGIRANENLYQQSQIAAEQISEQVHVAVILLCF